MKSSYAVLKTGSHVPGLRVALLHEAPATYTGKTPVLFIHGSSFPAGPSQDIDDLAHGKCYYDASHITAGL